MVTLHDRCKMVSKCRRSAPLPCIDSGFVRESYSCGAPSCVRAVTLLLSPPAPSVDTLFWFIGNPRQPLEVGDEAFWRLGRRWWWRGGRGREGRRLGRCAGHAAIRGTVCRMVEVVLVVWFVGRFDWSGRLGLNACDWLTVLMSYWYWYALFLVVMVVVVWVIDFLCLAGWLVGLT